MRIDVSRNDVSGLLAFFLLFSACLSAAGVKGKVIDQSGAPIAGAQVSLVSRVGVEAQTVSAPDGAFTLNRSLNDPGDADIRLVVTAPGFSTRTVPPGIAASIELEIAPQVDSVKVVGSAIDVPASQQGSSVSIVPR